MGARSVALAYIVFSDVATPWTYVFDAPGSYETGPALSRPLAGATEESGVGA